MASNLNYSPTPAGSLPATLVGSVTTEQVVLSAVATPVAVAGGTVPTFLPLILSIPSGSLLDSKEWSGSASVTLKLGSGTSATPGSNTNLATSGAVVFAAAGTTDFIISIEKAIYSTASGKLTGIAEILINGTVIARAAFVGSVTGINNANNPVLNLVLSAVFSVANVGNQLVVKNFEIDF